MTSVKRKEPEAETKAAGGSITLNDMQIASLPPRAKRGRRNNRRGENDIGEEDADAPAASDDAPAAADASDKGAGAGAGSAAESKEAKSDESKKAAKNWECVLTVVLLVVLLWFRGPHSDLDHTADIQLHSCTHSSVVLCLCIVLNQAFGRGFFFDRGLRGAGDCHVLLHDRSGHGRN